MQNQWQVAGESVRGAAHERNGLPNQDAIYWLPVAGHGSSLVLAVADGHGSARYSRSHIGASLAVESSVQLVQEFLDSQTGAGNLSLTKDATEEWLPRTIVRKWIEVVDEHLNSDPLDAPEQNLIAYGSTLLVTAVTEQCRAIGDKVLLRRLERIRIQMFIDDLYPLADERTRQPFLRRVLC